MQTSHTADMAHLQNQFEDIFRKLVSIKEENYAFYDQQNSTLRERKVTLKEGNSELRTKLKKAPAEIAALKKQGKTKK